MIDVMENIKKLSAALDAETASLHPSGKLLLLGSQDSVFLKAIKRKADQLGINCDHTSNPLPPYRGIVVDSETVSFNSILDPDVDIDHSYSPGMSAVSQAVMDLLIESGLVWEKDITIVGREELHGSILEPAAGEGHISKVLREHYPNSQIISTDLVQRDDRFGCGIVGGVDFLTENYLEKFNNVITNPPFSLAKEFAEKALEVSTGKVILFAKIQFLEGRQRKDFFATHPPKAVYVFSKRVNPLRNGLEVDENGKPWSSTMCFAWFVWEHGYTGEPCIRWI